MINRLAALYNKWILGNPGIVLIFLTCLFLFFGYQARYFDLDASADSLLLENDKDLNKFREITKRYESKEFLFVAFTPNGDVFSNDALQTIKALRDEFRAMDKIDSVVSLIDVPLVQNIGGGLMEVAKKYKTLEAKDTDIQKARQELLESPLFNELIISKDGRTTALMLYIKENQEYIELRNKRDQLLAKKHTEVMNEDDKRIFDEINVRYKMAKETVDMETHQMIKDIRTIMSKYDNQGQLYLGGVSMIADDMITYIKNDLVIFGIGVFIFLIGMLAVIFRQLRWVALPLLSCLFAGVLMIGLLGLIGWQVTVISSNFISLMLILTMSMNVHLVVRYRQLCRDYPERGHRELVFETTRKMVWPCLYTALTTMIGFGSLVVSDIKPVIDFGWMMTAGLTVTFLTSFLLFPSVLVMLNKANNDKKERTEVPFTSLLANITERHGNKVLAIAVLLAILSAVGMTRLKVENSFVNYFSEDTEIYQGLKLIDDKLGGTTTLDIVLKLNAGESEDVDSAETQTVDVSDDFDDLDALFGDIKTDKADYWFTPEKIDLIKEVHDYLDSLKAVGKVLSLASTVRVAESLVSGQEFDTFEMAILYKNLPEQLKTSMLSPYVSIEEDEARITIRVKDSMKDLRRKELLEKIYSDLIGKFGLSQEEVQMTGLLVLYNNMLQSLFKSQILTLGVVMLGIAIMLLILFQSVSLAVIGIIPNILAAAIILGLMGLLDIPLDMMTITIAAITIGIAVDNSIHYIYRFREEFKRNGDYQKTLHYCHANIGRAVFYTAITIIVGFSILVMSNFIPTIYFGLLTALAMFIALLAALTLLPKLLLIWKPF